MSSDTGELDHSASVLLTASEATVCRFMSFVEKLPCGCWFWNGARSRGKRNKKWYGSFHVSSEVGTVRAHRFAAEVLGRQPCPPGYHRDHTCQFSLCVNPGHLEVVTHTVNQERKVSRRNSDSGMVSSEKALT